VATVAAEAQGPGDAELIDAVRAGTLSAYGELYERHVAAAHNLARQLSRSRTEADDLVSEAFAKVLDTLRAGAGPDVAFRAYLLTTLRRTAYDKTRRDRKVELFDDVSRVRGMSAESVSVPFSDPAVARLERTLAARAFARLPERWQAVLWHTEIEGQSPADVAGLLGLTPNGVSALAYRAREGLKQAYLQVYLADNPERRCRATTDRLGAWTRGGLSSREKAQVEAHLDECARCRALAAELRDVNSGLRAVVGPLVLGAGAAAYLSAAGATKVAVTAGAAVGTAGGGGGAATALPRQFLGVAASGAALAAALVIALSVGGGAHEIPQAAKPDPAEARTPPANPPAPPTPSPPEVPRPPSPAAPPPALPSPPPAANPPVAPSSLVVTVPGAPVSLVAGGDPVDLPLSVRNNGGSRSGPPSSTLAWPPGVTAIPAGPSGFAGGPLLRLNAAAAGTVHCPGGITSVTCRAPAGLAPGDSVIMVFRLVAAAGSLGGEITGTVSDGTSASVPVRVRVVVRPPATVDGVTVLATGEWFDTVLPGLIGKRLVHVTATNTGTSAKPITLTVDRTGGRLNSTHQVACAAKGLLTSCTTADPVPPGGVVTLSFRINTGLLGLHCPDGAVTAGATLGAAKDSVDVTTVCWKLPLPRLVPNGGSPPPAPPPRSTVTPHLQPPPTPPAGVVAPTPVTPPRGSPLPGILGWLLPH
jgi:RNA polymerase sigma factor (sigma-70 family)